MKQICTQIKLLCLFSHKELNLAAISCGGIWGILMFQSGSLLSLYNHQHWRCWQCSCFSSQWKTAEVCLQSFQKVLEIPSSPKSKFTEWFFFLKNETKSATQMAAFTIKHSVTTQSGIRSFETQMQRTYKGTWKVCFLQTHYFHRSRNLSLHAKLNNSLEPEPRYFRQQWPLGCSTRAQAKQHKLCVIRRKELWNHTTQHDRLCRDISESLGV